VGRRVGGMLGVWRKAERVVFMKLDEIINLIKGLDVKNSYSQFMRWMDVKNKLLCFADLQT
jgi:hypothetical protein